MAPKKGTKAYKQEYVSTVYGIDPKTKKVRSIAVQRDGVMVSMGSDGTQKRHSRSGSSPEHEAVIAFGLTDVFTVPEVMRENVSYMQKVDELRQKAAKMEDETAEE